jgi:hypothetical protein
MENFPTDFVEKVERHMNAARRHRETVGYDVPFMPMLVIGTDHGDVPVFSAQAAEDHMATYASPAALDQIHRMVADEMGGTADMICLISDEVGMDLGDTPFEEAEKIHEELGSLVKAFADGHPNVREQMGYYVIEPKSRKVAYVAQPYRYIPSEGWSWDDPVMLDEKAGIPLEIEFALNTILDATRP